VKYNLRAIAMIDNHASGEMAEHLLRDRFVSEKKNIVTVVRGRINSWLRELRVMPSGHAGNLS
jgi:hypothetical protein